MYDDYDHRRSRSRPPSGDHHYRSRHDSSRSPPKGPRGDDSSRARRYHSPSYRRNNTQDDGDNRGYPREDAPYRRRESPGRRSGRHGYRDYDASHDYDGDNDKQNRRSASRSVSPYRSPDDNYHRDANHQHVSGRPYHTLKLDDVPDWLGPQEIDDAMRDMGARGLIEVRIKSDSRVGNRRCYAFAEFKYESDAVDFLDRYYPAIDIEDRNGAPTRIYIEYSRERRPAPNLDDWKCTLCHFDNFSRRATCKQCKAPRSSENAVEMRLDGQSDECPQQTPSQFVVIRGLAPSTNETTLATGIKKLYITKEDEPKQASGMPPKLRSTAPIGNTHGLGAKPGSLVRVFMVREKMSEISCNYGFAEFSTLDDARAAVAKYNAHPQFTISSKPVTVAFIHSGVFIPYLHPVQDQDRKFTFAATHNPTLRLSYWNPSVYANEHLIFDESLYEEKEKRPDHAKQAPDMPAGKDSKKRKADKDLSAPTGKKVIAMAPQLQMWANKHAELHGSKESSDGAISSEEIASVTVPITTKASESTVTTLPSVSYADLDQMCCLLCRRKFKNEPSLRRHEQMSDMHKANLKDESLIAKATQDLKALGKEPTSNYRDRAKERRLAHNQPMKPKIHLPRKVQSNNKEAEPTKDPPSKPAISKGAGLLAKMGWTTGEGLGAESGGRTDIIETMAYAPGVGLGAEGGKIGDAAQEAARATKNDYADFVSKAKDKARERYEKMG
ncbi:hypothetical protein F5B22DRAFT_470376 [Xylaria bambusicola]|uniref:uncharacterized protein n=1 Tax=Xylaria bambusicola TaxID=326684 RepID=UPI002008B4FF|nr:uncharacterized protein F5B22DRAFT_470376 [Xylaria bambusicola]KAI0522301.1 hypothetical protein F5B22DRAFT_470376 [Xylaria bambusicola]